MIEIGHASHTGLRREFNEDSYWADSGLGLFLVVDAMGGRGRGDVAAAIARDAMVLAARAGRDPAAALVEVGSSIGAFSAAAPGDAPTGAAIAWLKIDGERYRAVGIGDARTYLWQHGALSRLGADDARPSNESGAPPAADTATARRPRRRLTQALGITATADLDMHPTQGTLQRGMQFLLCTDGLAEELGDARIAALLARGELAAQECVDHLLLAALEAGGRDNMTAVLVRAM